MTIMPNAKQEVIRLQYESVQSTVASDDNESCILLLDDTQQDDRVSLQLNRCDRTLDEECCDYPNEDGWCLWQDEEEMIVADVHLFA